MTSHGLSEVNGVLLGDHIRKTEAQTSSDRLCDAIEELVVRASRQIAIPAEWKHKPLSFARAYLGMEVRS